jgi:hypothetical protein
MFLILSLERVLLIVKLKTLLLNPTFNILLKTVLYLLMPIYQQLVGSLIYLTVTRLNISYVVHIVRQLMSSPCTTHYVVVLQIIWYIKGTLFIVFTTQLHPHWFLKPTLMLIVSVIPVIIVPHLFLYISWRFSYIFVDFLLI